MTATNPLVLALGTLLLVLALIPATGIFLTYRRVDWRASKTGRVMHDKSVAIAVVLWLSTIAATLLLLGHGRPLWFELLRLAAFGYVALVLWRQWFRWREIVHHAERLDRHDDDELVSD